VGLAVLVLVWVGCIGEKLVALFDPVGGGLDRFLALEFKRRGAGASSLIDEEAVDDCASTVSSESKRSKGGGAALRCPTNGFDGVALEPEDTPVAGFPKSFDSWPSPTVARREEPS
jgi:hypothetical protein